MVPLHLVWDTRLCQDLFCRGGWIQGEFCLVLMEPLNNELENLQRRGINAHIKINIDWISSNINERKKPPRQVKNGLSKWRNHLAEHWKEVSHRYQHFGTGQLIYPEWRILWLGDQEQLLVPWARHEQHHQPVQGSWLSERQAGKSCAQKPEGKFSTDSALSFGFLL